MYRSACCRSRSGSSLLAALPPGHRRERVELESPDGAVRLEIDAAGGRLTFAIGRAGPARDRPLAPRG